MRRPLAAALALALAALPALAGVDVEIPAKAKAKGTLLPEGETETFRFGATAGTVVSMTVAAAKGSDLDLSLEVRDPDDVAVVLGAGVLTDKGTKLQVKGLELGMTGTWTIRVTAEGTGGYSFTFAAKARAAFGETLALPGSGTVPFTFSAPPGSQILLSAKAANGSAAVPRFGLLTGTDAPVDLSAQGNLGANSHAVTVAAIDGGGDYSVEVDNAAVPAGDAAVSVRVKAPKTKKAKLDLRGELFGMPGGGETVMSRLVGASGGTVSVDDPESDLDGATVEVPPGAFDEPTTVTIRSSEPIVPATDEENQASGPSVDLGPSGTTFGEAVTVILPYDPAQVPADADPQDLRVLIQEENGSTTTATPSSVDEEANTVTVETTGFSICVPISVPGITRIGLGEGGDQYWALMVECFMETDGSDDSRGRQFRLELGEVAFYDDFTFEASLEEREIRYDDAEDGSGFTSTATASTPAGTWSYGPGGQTILLDAGEEGGPVLTVTRDARYAVGRNTVPGDPAVRLDMFIRKHPDPLTLASLDGTYSFFGEELSTNFGGGVELKASRTSATITFDGEGGFVGSHTQRALRFDPTDGTYFFENEGGPAEGTYLIQEDGSVYLTFAEEEPGEEPDNMLIFPGENLDVLMGTDNLPCGGCSFFFVMVRQSSDFDASLLVGGEYLFQGMEIEPNSFGGPPFVSDLWLADEAVALTFQAAGDFSGQQEEHSVQRNPSVTGGVEIANDSGDLFGTWTVDRKGKLVISVPGEPGAPIGAVVPAGDAGCLLTNVTSNDPGILFGLFVKPPPLKP